MTRKNTRSSKHRLCHAARRCVKAMGRQSNAFSQPHLRRTSAAGGKGIFCPVANRRVPRKTQWRQRLNAMRSPLWPLSYCLSRTCRFATILKPLNFYRRKRRERSGAVAPSCIFSVPSVASCKMVWGWLRLCCGRLGDDYNRQLSRTGWRRAPQVPGCRSKWPAISAPHFRQRLPSRS